MIKFLLSAAMLANIFLVPAQAAKTDVVCENDITTRAATRLVIQFTNEKKGFVSGCIKNTFTLFPSTVEVYLYLYSSEVYSDSVAEMTVEDKAYTADLDIGKSLTVSAKADTQRYWKLYAVAYVDSNSATILKTPTTLFNTDGVPLE